MFLNHVIGKHDLILEFGGASWRRCSWKSSRCFLSADLFCIQALLGEFSWKAHEVQLLGLLDFMNTAWLWNRSKLLWALLSVRCLHELCGGWVFLSPERRSFPLSCWGAAVWNEAHLSVTSLALAPMLSRCYRCYYRIMAAGRAPTVKPTTTGPASVPAVEVKKFDSVFFLATDHRGL